MGILPMIHGRDARATRGHPQGSNQRVPVESFPHGSAAYLLILVELASLPFLKPESARDAVPGSQEEEEAQPAENAPCDNRQQTARCPLTVDPQQPADDAKDQSNNPPDSYRLSPHRLLPGLPQWVVDLFLSGPNGVCLSHYPPCLGTSGGISI
jgi:hypothetical protein